jgi:hypothetical protein
MNHHIEDELKQKYPDIKFELYPNEKHKRIYLTGFMVPYNMRGTGIGTSFMNDLTSLADQHGYKLTLTPSSSYGGNVNRLKDFYQRFGFVFNKGDNRDFTHKEDMYRDPKINEEDSSNTSSTTSSSSGGTSASNSPVPDRVKKGKANPISNTGKYEFGTTRGKANPISNTGTYDFGTNRGPANPIPESVDNTAGKTIISVDIQPEYSKYILFNLNTWVDMINQHDGQIVFLYNGYDTLGMVEESEYKNWLYELGVNEEIVYDSATFYDKGYAFFRYCIDSDIDDEDIVGLVKMMIEYDINDSRELNQEFWDEFISRYGKDHVRELLEFSDDCINIPDLMDFLRRYSNILLCGGGQNECLKEVEIALMALDKPYTKMDSYIYEKNNRLDEAIINMKKLINF